MPTVCVDAVKENLPNVIEFVTKMLGENADGKLVFELELICEEVFVNICNYAYGENVGKAEIEVSKLSDSIVVKFIDSGKKFNPLEIAEPNIHAPLEERSIGGLGIFMTKKLSDALSYDRSNGKNIFTITKNYSSLKIQNRIIQCFQNQVIIIRLSVFCHGIDTIMEMLND